MYSESSSKVKVALLTVNTFPNYAYVSSYFELKSFPWKRDWTISQNKQMVRLWVRPFLKPLTEFYISHSLTSSEHSLIFFNGPLILGY